MRGGSLAGHRLTQDPVLDHVPELGGIRVRHTESYVHSPVVAFNLSHVDVAQHRPVPALEPAVRGGPPALTV